MRLLWIVLLVFLVSCGPAVQTGSRGPEPNVWAGAIGVYWWPGATAQEQQWLTETANKHAKLMAQHLGSIPRVDVRFYKTPADLNTAASKIAVNNRPNTYNLTRIRSVMFSSGVGEAFLNRGVVHIYAGPKLEGPELGHSLMHAAIEPKVIHHVAPNINATALHFRGSHSDPAWPNLLTDDFILSLQLAAQR